MYILCIKQNKYIRVMRDVEGLYNRLKKVVQMENNNKEEGM